MMTNAISDHKYATHQVTQDDIDDAGGAFKGLSEGLSKAFGGSDATKEAVPEQKARKAIGRNTGRLHKAINQTEDALEEIYLAMWGLAHLCDIAGSDNHIPAATVSALIAPHIRSTMMLRGMLHEMVRGEAQ